MKIKRRFVNAASIALVILQLFYSTAFAGFLYLPFDKFYTPIGYVGSYDGHTGTDYRGAGYDTPVYAAYDGTIVALRETENDGCDITYSQQLRYGNYVKIDHQVGSAKYRTEYWHLKQNGVVVNVGQEVKTGDLIAYVSNSGETRGSDCAVWSDLPYGAYYHLHFEVKKWDGSGWAVLNPYSSGSGWLWTTNLPTVATSAPPPPPPACGWQVGQDSSRQRLFQEAYNRNGGQAVLGCPTWHTYWWAGLIRQDFSNAAILHNEGGDNPPFSVPAYVVRGGIWNYYQPNPYRFGFPISDEFVNSFGKLQSNFQNEFIFWDGASARSASYDKWFLLSSTTSGQVSVTESEGGGVNLSVLAPGGADSWKDVWSAKDISDIGISPDLRLYWEQFDNAHSLHFGVLTTGSDGADRLLVYSANAYNWWGGQGWVPVRPREEVNLGVWESFSRNIYDDYQAEFGLEPLIVRDLRAGHFVNESWRGEVGGMIKNIAFDFEPPQTGVSISPAGPDGDIGWYVTPPAVILSATDDASGVDRIEYDLGSGWQIYSAPFLVEQNGEVVLKYRAFDRAGRVSEEKQSVLYVDTTPPTSSLGDVGVYHNSFPVSVLVDSTDNVEVSRIGIYKRRAGESEWAHHWTSSSGNVPREFNIWTLDEGRWELVSRATDTAGNVEDLPEEPDVSIVVDQTPPATELSMIGPKYESESGEVFVSSQTEFELSADDTNSVNTSVETSGVSETDYRYYSETYDSEEQIYEEPVSLEGNDGEYIVEYDSTDVAGNVEPTNSQTFYLDSMPPISSDDSDGEWCNKDVTVTVIAQDPSAPDGTSGSGVQGIVYGGTQEGAVLGGRAQITYTEEGTHDLNYFAVDNVGNVENLKEKNPVAPIKIDKTPPEISGVPTEDPNENDWYNKDVAVHFDANDQENLSGLKSVTPDVVVSTEGVSQEVAGNAEDNAGNTANSVVSGINIDKTPPSSEITSIEEGEYYNAESWERVGGGVIGTARDNLSGVAGVEVEIVGRETGDAQLEDYGEFQTGWEYLLGFAEDGSDDRRYIILSHATDLAGNTEATDEVFFTYDTTPPITSAEVSGKEGLNGWYQSNVEVALSATDNLSPVVKTEYQLDPGSEGAWVEGTTVEVTGDGEHQLFYRSQDAAGNIGDLVSYPGSPVKIDTVRPTSVKAQDVGTWSATRQLTFTWPQSFDETSGVDHYELWISTETNERNAIEGLNGIDVGNTFSYTLTKEQGDLLSEDTTYFAKVKVYDRAGWVSRTNQYNYSDGIKIDVTPPRVDKFYLADQSSADQRFTNSTGVKLFIEDWDNASGVSGWYISEDDNSPITSGFTDPRPEIFALSDGDGLKLLSVWVRDLAGNISEAGSVSIVLDTVAPVTSVSLSGLSGLNGWYISPVRISFEGADATSGVSGTFYRILGSLGSDPEAYSGTIELSDGTYEVEFWSVDRSGNEEEHHIAPLKVDTTAPAAPASSAADGNFFEGGQVVVSLSSAGGDEIYYSINGGDFTLYTGDLVIAGATLFSAYAVDEAGNKSVVVSWSFIFVPKPPVASSASFLASPLLAEEVYAAENNSEDPADLEQESGEVQGIETVLPEEAGSGTNFLFVFLALGVMLVLPFLKSVAAMLIRKGFPR